MELYAAIRGVSAKDIARLANQFMEGLRIKEHAKKYSNDCSGGTKRKLSYAMAMLGKPKIVLLDEPSTGMDPKSKRFVWDTILASFRVRRTTECIKCSVSRFGQKLLWKFLQALGQISYL